MKFSSDSIAQYVARPFFRIIFKPEVITFIDVGSNPCKTLLLLFFVYLLGYFHS